MSKTEKISVTNFKAISNMEIDFKGCTAIITGGNNKGKSTLLRGIVDRIRGERPELIVKQGEKEGRSEIVLTTGEKFIWEFDIEGGDKLIFITKDGFKTKVTKEISKRFFPVTFDIDKFLNDAPKEQSKQLQKIVGVNFTEIDARYALAYSDRTEKNKEAERFQVKLTQMLECPKVDPVDLVELQAEKELIKSKLNKKYLENKSANDKVKTAHENAKQDIRDLVTKHNETENEKQKVIDSAKKAKKEICDLLDSYGIVYLVDISKLEQHILDLPKPADLLKNETELLKLKEPVLITPELPDDSELQAVDKKLLTASEINTEAKAYDDYMIYKKSVENAKSEAADADIKVKDIEQEREDLIKTAKMPVGIAFGEDGITVDGFPLDKNQISTSKLYCAALRIASLNIGEVRTLHFDASSLDKNTLTEIEVWAQENDLQLLIERADYDAGNIRYELIEK